MSTGSREIALCLLFDSIVLGRHSQLYLYLLAENLHLLLRLSSGAAQTSVHASSERHSAVVNVTSWSCLTSLLKAHGLTGTKRAPSVPSSMKRLLNHYIYTRGGF